MTTLRPSPWVPASLLRLRCFLNGRGMKVRPWLGPRDVLAAFCGALKSQERDDAFWTDLRGLLANLGRDMQLRAEARGWAAVQELFDAEGYEDLLVQIRRALKEERRSDFGVAELARALPGRAAALLLMVGAAVSVGCGGETGDTPSSDSATGGAAAATGGAGSGGASASGGAVNTGGTGGRSMLVLTGGTATGGYGGGAADPADTPTCNGELAEVIGECNLSESDKSTLLGCACLLNDAWETGLAKLFENADCNEIVQDYFACCYGSNAARGPRADNLCDKDPRWLPAEFDPELLADNSCCLVYLGVRCD